MARPLPFLPLLMEVRLVFLAEVEVMEVILALAMEALATSFSVRALLTGGGANVLSSAIALEDPGTVS